MPPATSGLGQPKTTEERDEVDAANAALGEAINTHLPFSIEPALISVLPRLRMSWICSITPIGFCSQPARRSTFRLNSLPDNFRYVGPLLDVPNWSKSLQSLQG